MQDFARAEQLIEILLSQLPSPEDGYQWWHELNLKYLEELNKALSGVNKDQDAIKITFSDTAESLEGEEWFGEKIIRTLSVTLSTYDPFLLENTCLKVGYFYLTEKLPFDIGPPKGHELLIEPWKGRDYWKILPDGESRLASLYNLTKLSSALELWRKFIICHHQPGEREKVLLPYLNITIENDLVLREGVGELDLGNAALRRKLFRLVLDRRGEAIANKDLILDVYDGNRKSASTFSSLKADLNDKLMGLKLEIDVHNRLVAINPKSR